MSPRNALTTAFAHAGSLSHGGDTSSVTVGTPTQMRSGHTKCGSGHLPCAGADTSAGADLIPVLGGVP
ncbi:Uncharacterised protein [Mycobacteroides abscessus]|uniref:Uncharacterized protein n=1 Tax=Mycobacteroides abscessus TaxID=36809 RepID=A0AB33SX79_9MYCO|nr:Uncharacterised protein [Mycobacteroides abscessus]CPT67923.1 Uncharacterised protein [Mycobacteroides abscessus]CPT69160.1 Uncharacterised protein [Mycobacteroides abscessus]CPV12676.1 Uncharacterised protein [Mycobacteroides abscessus]CPV59498.1 Uncharacterised protein [Mycobacteroides abscessus]